MKLKSLDGGVVGGEKIERRLIVEIGMARFWSES